MEDAEAFSNEILAVFMPALLLVTAIFVIFMPGVLLLVVPEYGDTPGKLELATELSRWTFPYLLFISLVALLSGVLNSLTRFAVAAFAPALLNVALIVSLLVARGSSDVETVRIMAIAVLLGGVAQFALCWFAVRRAGVKLRFGRPRLTPAVRELVILILPATAAAGVYQLSQLFYAYFSSRLGEGALTDAQLRRPAQPAAAVDHRHRARRRHPAVDQPGDRPRRRGRGGRRPGPRLRPVDAADPAGDAGADGGELPDHRRALPRRRIFARGGADHRPASSPSSSPACPLTCWSRC